VHLNKYIFNLGSCLLSITIDDEMMKEHLEINLHSNEILNDIACNLNWIEFKYSSNPLELYSNSIQIQSNSYSIKKHKMQIDAKSIENLLVISIICEYGVGGGGGWKDTNPKKIPLHFSK
jgi:hypothetical protein